MIVFNDYPLCNECKNESAVVLCLQCGKCGRKFDMGEMIDKGDTTMEDLEEC